MSVACPVWAPEAAAQVEARIRASLLLDGRGVRSVKVSCLADTASVDVDSERGQLVRPVTRRGVSLEDDVVEAVERALEELNVPAVVEGPKPGGETAAPLAAEPAAPAAAATRPVSATAPSNATNPRRQRVVQVEARALGERWSDHWAWGGEAGFTHGDARLQYGLALAGRVATGEPTSFAINEWSAAARGRLCSHALLGVCGSASVGASAFVVSPTTGVVAESATLLGSAFLELSLSRPVWFGDFGFAPALGARLFSASRNVRVNAQEELRLPLLAPQASLALVARFPL